MKLTKSQLRQLIREELNVLNEATDPQRIFAKYPKVLEAVEGLINTPKELMELLSIIVNKSPIKDQQKVLALRAVLKQAGQGPEPDDSPSAGQPPPEST
tara:strand:+ start:217 stop:513 length:297 start_codon:yes stop_codon:yes gene_type:complete